MPSGREKHPWQAGYAARVPEPPMPPKPSERRVVAIPAVDGRPSTSALGRAVVADALRAVDPVGARSAEGETSWRQAYLGHFRRLVEAGLPDRAAALTIARDGLASLRARLVAPDAF